MKKTITDEKLIEEFLTRGVEAIYPSKEELKKKLMSGERLRAYQGFDPTGPYLHVGHAMGIRAMRLLQKLGHEVIFLVGDYTAKVGDPDKDTTRRMLTDEEIEKNMSGWKEQAAQLIDFSGDNPVRFERNYKWLSKLTSFDMLKLMSNITLPQILQRDLFKKRLEADGDTLKLHEIVYPLLQGYDGVAMEVDIEIGGADQTFNMLRGRDLSLAYLKKEKFVRANKMMDAPDGRTMSKTKGNGINLSDSPEDMFGKAMSYSDDHIISGLEFLTEVPMEDIEKTKKNLEAGANPMEAKKRMAYEIVKMIKGEKAAEAARDNFEKVFSRKELPEEIVPSPAPPETTLIELMVNEGLAASKGDAKRKIEQGGVSIDGAVIKDLQYSINESDNGKVLKVGKREFRRIETV
ncbi:MAG: tyrosyl-tRNA synthetase [Patescibacteria group bacterium]|nr:tyrosyl-tRNA synthetase [Patescibacteria group bacterium]